VDQGFASDTRQVDFASPVVVEQVNAWVKQATSGRIPTILSEPPGPVVLMLLNAVYFKGDWLDRFDSTLTKPDTFATSSHRKVIVPFMQSRRHVRYWATDSLQGLLLPYRGGNLSALLVLPSGSHSPSSLLPALSASRLATWRQTRLVTDIILRFPRLELRGEYDLRTPLISLGLRQAFDNRSANFGRLSPRPLFISDSRQVTFLKVNEQGTEAAAVTRNSFQIRSAPRPPVPVIFNRPFLFGIVDNVSGELLFIGQVGDPSANPD